MWENKYEKINVRSSALHEVGAIGDPEMKEFDRQCLSPITSNKKTVATPKNARQGKMKTANNVENLLKHLNEDN